MNNQHLAKLTSAAQAKQNNLLLTCIDQLDAQQFDPFRLTEAAVEVKVNGFPDAAKLILEATLRSHGEYVLALYELAVLERLAGHHSRAVDLLVRARACDRYNSNVQQLLAHMLYAVGANAEARQITQEMRRQITIHLDVLDQFGSYLDEFPHEQARIIISEVKKTYEYLDTHRVAERIKSAISGRQGFSLIRLGDGEGAFFQLSKEDEEKYTDLYAMNRREWYDLLYGSGFDAEGTGYAELVKNLYKISVQADIVGVPYQSWVDHEYTISSTRGIPCLLNIHRAYLGNKDSQKPMLCDQAIHSELGKSGLLEPILRSLDHISIISCHEELADKLKNRFEFRDVTLYKIPGERYSSHLLSQEALKGSHFPTVFNQIMSELSQPLNGRVFLIAAGTLAKWYAHTIKGNGGIALDLGSLVDSWLGVPTRPTFDGSLAL